MPQVDNRLLTKMFREHEAALRHYLMGKVGSAEEAEDIAQEAFLKLHLMDDANDIKHPRAFLFRVAVNVLIDHIRRRRSRISELQIAAEIEGMPADDPSAESKIRSREFQSAFKRAIQELPPRRRQVIVMHKILQKSYGEIAEELGITRSMVEQHMTRALRHCRMRLEHLK